MWLGRRGGREGGRAYVETNHGTDAADGSGKGGEDGGAGLDGASTVPSAEPPRECEKGKLTHSPSTPPHPSPTRNPPGYQHQIDAPFDTAAQSPPAR
jgi:hypothetical protein